MKRTYSKKELKYLKKNYGKLKTEDIISFLGISKSALFTKAMRMKLTKDRAWTKKRNFYFQKILSSSHQQVFDRKIFSEQKQFSINKHVCKIRNFKN